MNDDRVTRFHKATAALSEELASDLKDAQEVVQQAEAAESEAEVAVEQAIWLDRSAKSRLREAENRLREVETQALLAAVRDTETFTNLAAQHIALSNEISLMRRGVDRFEAYQMRDANQALLQAQHALAKANVNCAATEFALVENNIFLALKAAADANQGATVIPDEMFGHGKAGELHRAAVRFTTLEEGLSAALRKHQSETEELRREYMKGLRK